MNADGIGAAQDHQRILVRSADLVAGAVQRDRLRVADGPGVRHQGLRLREPRHARPITDGIGSNESPAFSPNGRHIAFTSTRTGKEQIFLIDRDGKNLRQITRTGMNRIRTGRNSDADPVRARIMVHGHGNGLQIRERVETMIQRRLVVVIVAIALARCGRVRQEEAAGRAADAPPPAGGAPPPAEPAAGSAEPVREPEPIPAEPIAADPLSGDGHRHHQQELAVPAGVLRLRQAEIDAAGQQALNTNAELMKKYPTWVITIEGHSDERGTAEYNLALGERRALAARTYLVSLGIPADRLRTVSYGKEFPFDPGHDEGAWSKNRRAHFVVTSK